MRLVLYIEKENSCCKKGGLTRVQNNNSNTSTNNNGVIKEWTHKYKTILNDAL